MSIVYRPRAYLPQHVLEELIAEAPTEKEREIAAHVAEILALLGEDVQREGLRKTPMRVAKMFTRELFSGLSTDLSRLLTTFDGDGYDEMVVVKGIPFASICEHHLVPFIGKAHIGYVPDGRIVGLSKFGRLVDALARRPQTQERLTTQIADSLTQYLNPRGVMVVLEAEHLCMAIRGIERPGVTTVTSAIRGVFAEPQEGSREEFLRLIGLGGSA